MKATFISPSVIKLEPENDAERVLLSQVDAYAGTMNVTACSDFVAKTAGAHISLARPKWMDEKMNTSLT